MHCTSDTLGFFQTRLVRLLPDLPNREIRSGLAQWLAALRGKAAQVGGMEVPFYQLAARKPQEVEWRRS